VDTGTETAESVAEERARERWEAELVVARLIEALSWCGAAACFGDDSTIRAGWTQVCEPAIQRAYRWIDKETSDERR
jgi:hypothetical protein